MGNGGPMQTVGYMDGYPACRLNRGPRRDGSITTVVVVWLILAVIAELALFFLLSPHMPPGRASVEASDQTTTNIVLAAVMIPILAGVWVFFGYALATFRDRGRVPRGTVRR